MIQRSLFMCILPCFIFLLFLFTSPPISSSLSPSPSPSSSLSPPSFTPRSILILGSGGLVGSALSSHLSSHYPHYTLYQVRNRTEVDLRVPGSLASFVSSLPSPPDYVFFLACEVGGSKYIDSKSGNVQYGIIRSNVAMYDNVLDYLYARDIPFLFSSSTLQSQETAYGSIKRLGEQWIQSKALDKQREEKGKRGEGSQSLGKIVRLWNIYGKEKLGLKSHVISDWINICLSPPSPPSSSSSSPSSSPLTRHVHSLTDGHEHRQFLHSADTARALVSLMHSHFSLPLVTDLSSSSWVSLRSVAALVAELSPFPCSFSFSSSPAAVREQKEPDRQTLFWKKGEWREEIGLREGIKGLFEEYAREKGIIIEGNEGDRGEKGETGRREGESGKTSCGIEEGPIVPSVKKGESVNGYYSAGGEEEESRLAHHAFAPSSSSPRDL